MAQIDYSNNNRSKNDIATKPAEPTKPKVPTTIITPKKVRKRNVAEKFCDVFLAEDLHEVKRNFISNTLVPLIKNFAFDLITNGSREFIFGGKGKVYNTNPTGSTYKYHNYNSISTGTMASNAVSYVSAASYPIDNILLNSNADAEAVINDLSEYIAQYQFASVGYLYQLIGKSPEPTAFNWGWDQNSFKGVSILATREGWLLRLPKTVSRN